MKEELLERFLRYVKVDTQSDEKSTSYPSTNKQLAFGHQLKDELIKLGFDDVHMDKYGYVFATLRANIEKSVPVIGFLAHMDTSPEMTGKNVKPLIHKNYSGEPLWLNKDVVLDPIEFPELNFYKGQTLITTDGTTLLGADDKAGMTEIITALHYLKQNPEIKHGEIKMAFTVDEEIGKGVDHFDVKKFGANFAYTLDGGQIGELEYENFNAAMAVVTISGRNVHPGTAKDKMINASQLALEFHNLLPNQSKPEYTTKYEGFFHLLEINGSVEKSVLKYIVRDHNRKKFESKKALMMKAIEFLNQKYEKPLAKAEIIDQYFNMREEVEKSPEIIDLAIRAYKKSGVEPIIKPIRGGTDGARLSYMGLPTPNIFAGGHNFHGRYEFVPLESMLKAVQVIINICALNAE